MPISERTEYFVVCDQHLHVQGPPASWEGAARDLAEDAGWTIRFSAQTNRWSYLCPDFAHVRVR